MHHQWAALKVRSVPSQGMVFLSLCREWRQPSTLSVEKGPDSAKVLQFTLFTALYQRQLLVTTSSATGSTTPFSSQINHDSGRKCLFHLKGQD